MPSPKPRKIDSIRVAILYGVPRNFSSPTEAMRYIEEQPDKAVGRKP
jgi:hypothetical protein